MNTLNNFWPGVQQQQQSSLLSQLTPAQLFMLQQQFQQQSNAVQNFENLMHSQQHQQIHHQRPNHIQKTSSPMSSPFSSSFSVNNLLSSTSSTQATNQHLANAVLSRHIAQVMANMQQQIGRQQQLVATQEHVLQAPAKKKQKLNEPTADSNNDSIQTGLNSSICSVSSPSSSSSSSSPFSSSSVSFENTTNNHEVYANQANQTNYQNLEYLLKSSSNSMENHGSSSSASLSLNESNELFSEVQFDSARSSPTSFNDSDKQQQRTPLSVRRSNRKRIAVDLQNPCCPICGLSLRLTDLKAHLENEIERLESVNNFCGLMTSLLRNESEPSQASNSHKRTLSGFEKVKPLSSSQNEMNNNSRRQAYLKIKENRQERIKNKLRVRMKENKANNTHLCPLCNDVISSDFKDQINSHLQTCSMLRNDDNADNKGDFQDHHEDDSNQDVEYETYEWAGQKRVRAITMLENPAQGIDATNVKKEEFEGELNVDFDENDFGKPQFNESDLIPIKSDKKEKNLLRQAVIDKEKSEDIEEARCEPHTSNKVPTPDNRDTTRCLICMENYTEALISVNCWHVHCRTCWMQSLGAKKLCPQCKVITSPKDLRRIFL